MRTISEQNSLYYTLVLVILVSNLNKIRYVISRDPLKLGVIKCSTHKHAHTFHAFTFLSALVSFLSKIIFQEVFKCRGKFIWKIVALALALGFMKLRNV